MEHRDFRLGLEFWCGGKRWRCTDVGSRVITAISLEPHEVVELVPNPCSSGALERRYVTADPAWHSGPPYAVAEQVFDENDMPACSLTVAGS
jgi:hypothetical protein